MKKIPRIASSALALLAAVATIVALGLSASASRPPPTQTCSTFLLEGKDTLLVGHNLDESIEVPGLIVVNPRNVSKRGVSWDDLNSFFGKSKPRLRWVSKYASLTYNTFGKEFIDGGLNEAGLYVGEMTLLGTKYPRDKHLIRLYHHQWMQYLLDNFATVGEVVTDLSRVTVDGHCQWHFFVADSTGRTAVIEFLEGRTVVYRNERMPVKALCNRRYARELDSLNTYAGFGGARAVDLSDTTDDRRFVWAAHLMKESRAMRPVSMVESAFGILRQLDTGSNRWSIVCDLKGRRMYFHTHRSRTVRFVDLKAFDQASGGPAMVLDIHRALRGDVKKEFEPFTQGVQEEYVKKAWDEIDTGLLGNLFFKPKMVRRLSTYAKDFASVP